ncbi:hypothetical protein BJ684DRAFT_21841, partial [Piptocephalis cylindrospora]
MDSSGPSRRDTVCGPPATRPSRASQLSSLPERKRLSLPPVLNTSNLPSSTTASSPTNTSRRLARPGFPASWTPSPSSVIPNPRQSLEQDTSGSFPSPASLSSTLPSTLPPHTPLQSASSGLSRSSTLSASSSLLRRISVRLSSLVGEEDPEGAHDANEDPGIRVPLPGQVFISSSSDPSSSSPDPSSPLYPSPTPSNSIRTSRYTLWSFIPRQLYAQFSKIANVYFLFISILQLIP